MARCFLTLVSLTSLLVVAVGSPRLRATFKKLSEEEASANSTWAFKSTVLEYGSVRLENCGPPLSVSMTPFPPVHNKPTYSELNLTAAHDLLGGELSLYVNIWSYEIQYDWCNYMSQQRGITVCPLKKGETYMYWDWVILVEHQHMLPDSGHLMGNITITNDFGDVILCISADAKLPLDW